MTTIAKFDSPEEAYLFLGFLGSREIAATVLDEHMAQLFWHYRAATGGVRVVIHDDADQDAAEAARCEYFAAINARHRCSAKCAAGRLCCWCPGWWVCRCFCGEKPRLASAADMA